MILRLWPLSIIFYTDKLPDGVGGRANGPVIRIRPKYKMDAGLHEHELMHVAQWWVTFGLHPLMYKFWRRYRRWAEAVAYVNQTWFPSGDGGYMTTDEAAVLLADARYDLGMSVQEAKAYLLTV